jgi:hypothetical protein
MTTEAEYNASLLFQAMSTEEKLVKKLNCNVPALYAMSHLSSSG